MLLITATKPFNLKTFQPYNNYSALILFTGFATAALPAWAKTN